VKDALGRYALPNGWNVLDPEGHRLAGAGIKDGQGHESLLFLIQVSHRSRTLFCEPQHINIAPSGIALTRRGE
jgi:hypothetical protein